MNTLETPQLPDPNIDAESTQNDGQLPLSFFESIDFKQSTDEIAAQLADYARSELGQIDQLIALIHHNESGKNATEFIGDIARIQNNRIQLAEISGYVEQRTQVKPTMKMFFTGERSKLLKLAKNKELRELAHQMKLKMTILGEVITGRGLLLNREWSQPENTPRTEWLNKWLDKHKVAPDASFEEIVAFERTLSFIDERLRLEQRNGVNVVMLDWDREIRENKHVIPLHPAFEQLLKDETFQQVVIEYFAPELKVKADELPLLKKLTHHQLVGNDRNTYRLRMFGFDGISMLASKYKKDVATLDVANNFTYMVDRDLVPFLPWAAVATAIAVDLLPTVNAVFDSQTLILLIQGAMYASLLSFWRRDLGPGFLAMVGLGHLAIDHNIMDKFTFQLEDARRVFAANAIDEMTLQAAAEPETDAQNDKNILVVYPPHHNSRFQHYMKHPSVAKQLLYLARHPWLKPMLRRYRKSEPEPGEQKGEYSGWNLISETKVPLRLDTGTRVNSQKKQPVGEPTA